MRTGAVLIAGLGFGTLAGVPAMAQAVQTLDARDLLARIQRLERDTRDLQAETFRRAPGDRTASSVKTEAAPAAESQQTAVPDLNPVMRRIDELEDGIGRLTGQMEELGHQVDQLSQKADRLQKQMDFQAAAQAKSATDMPAVPADGANELASINPDQSAPVPRPSGAPPANLGRIPAGTPMPAPANRPAEPKREFDAAMNLLSRAQYDKASEAFRAYADGHPDEERASDALYWTGDIAYSAKKDYPEAARDFAELLKKYPKSQRAPEGMLKLGLALFELGQTKEGCAALAALPAKYPDAATTVATRAKNERGEKKCR
jgi:tol-pal system protein YbgF